MIPWRSVTLAPWPAGKRRGTDAPTGEASLARALLVWRDKPSIAKGSHDGKRVRPDGVDWTGIEGAIASNRGSTRRSATPATRPRTVSLSDADWARLGVVAEDWDGNRSEALRSLLDWYDEEREEFRESMVK